MFYFNGEKIIPIQIARLKKEQESKYVKNEFNYRGSDGDKVIVRNDLSELIYDCKQFELIFNRKKKTLKLINTIKNKWILFDQGIHNDVRIVISLTGGTVTISNQSFILLKRG